MPPTELMKILSRTDHIKRKFIEFLYSNNIVSEYGKGYRYLNPLPYTFSETILELEKPTLLKCLGMSFCEENATINNKRYVHYFTVDNINFHANSKFYTLDISNKMKCVYMPRSGEIVIILPKEIVMIQTYSEYSEKVTSYSLGENWYNVELKNIRALTIACGHSIFSALFANPINLECPNKRICILHNLGGNTILLSTNETIVNLVRRYYLNYFMVKLESNLGLNIETPLMEFLDYVTLSLPTDFNGGCIQFTVFNPFHRPVNSIVKSYKHISKVIVDGVTEYSYRHSIIRVALPPFSSTRFGVCLHSFII